MKYDHYKNPFHQHWRIGFDSGCCDNARFEPEGRAGDELAAYTEGFNYGEKSHDEYLESEVLYYD